MNKNNLPLRVGVGVIVLNKENKIFVGKRKDNAVDKWQMPQGGVEKNENFLSAMKRELEEETSIVNIKVLKEFDQWFEYELPEKLLGIVWKGKFRGQRQRWFVARFIGEDKEINLKTKYPEFIEWKWIKIDELTNVVVDFKKDIYKTLSVKLMNFIN